MAPVIWGLDLGDFKWGKFKSNYMFKNRDYHLRRTKFAVYQCALIFCVISESLGTAVLSDYIDIERWVQTRFRAPTGPYPDLYVSNNDYVGAASYNIFAGVFVAFIFGAAFFFDLMWPERHESKNILIAWKVCGVLAVVIHLASAITLTVITFTHNSYCKGVDAATCQRLVSQAPKHSEAPLRYGHGGRAIAAVVFVWLGWVSVLGSCVLLFLGIDNTEKGSGPKSRSATGREQAHWNATHSWGEQRHDPELGDTDSEKPPQSPAQTHQPPQTDGADDQSLPYATPSAEIPQSGYAHNAQHGTVNAGAAAAAQAALNNHRR